MIKFGQAMQIVQSVLNFNTVSKNERVVNAMVELDQMKQELQTYESPLAEVRDSL